MLVHPSRSEGWGLSIAEAMAHGLAVILPHYGPPLEFVSNDTAFIFPARRYVPGNQGWGELSSAERIPRDFAELF